MNFSVSFYRTHFAGGVGGGGEGGEGEGGSNLLENAQRRLSLKDRISEIDIGGIQDPEVNLRENCCI